MNHLRKNILKQGLTLRPVSVDWLSTAQLFVFNSVKYKKTTICILFDNLKFVFNILTKSFSENIKIGS